MDRGCIGVLWFREEEHVAGAGRDIVCGEAPEVGDSTRGSVGEEVMGLFFEVSTVNEEFLARFERVLGGMQRGNCCITVVNCVLAT